jgi:hypothetical protein
MSESDAARDRSQGVTVAVSDSGSRNAQIARQLQRRSGSRVGLSGVQAVPAARRGRRDVADTVRYAAVRRNVEEGQQRTLAI